jgi:hypothetical protein
VVEEVDALTPDSQLQLGPGKFKPLGDCTVEDLKAAAAFVKESDEVKESEANERETTYTISDDDPAVELEFFKYACIELQAAILGKRPKSGGLAFSSRRTEFFFMLVQAVSMWDSDELTDAERQEMLDIARDLASPLRILSARGPGALQAVLDTRAHEPGAEER